MSVRGEFADALRAVLPKNTRVMDHARPVDAITDPLVMLERTQVEKPANSMGGYLTTFTVHVVGPKQDKDTQDDQLDDQLDAILVALDGVSWLSWKRATRAVFLDTWPSFTVEVQTVTAKEKGV